jgi:hypothetical protein
MMPADLAPTEPSVLDWVKSILRGRPIRIPEPAARENGSGEGGACAAVARGR